MCFSCTLSISHLVVATPVVDVDVDDDDDDLLFTTCYISALPSIISTGVADILTLPYLLSPVIVES